MPALSHHPCLAAPAAEAQTISQHLTPGGARWPRKPTWRFGCFFVTCATFAGDDFVAQLVVGTFGSCTATPSTAGLTWQAVHMNTIWWRELQVFHNLVGFVYFQMTRLSGVEQYYFPNSKKNPTPTNIATERGQKQRHLPGYVYSLTNRRIKMLLMDQL